MKAKYVKPTVEILDFLTEEIASSGSNPSIGGVTSSDIGDRWDDNGEGES